MTQYRLTNTQWQMLKLFARGRDAGFIAEALQQKQSDVDDTLRTVANDDPEQAAKAVTAYEAQAVTVAAARGIAPPPPLLPSAPPASSAPPPPGITTPVMPVQRPAGPGPVPPTRSLLERAAGSGQARTRALASKIHKLMADLSARLDAEDAERLARAEKERARLEAEARIAALQAELAKAQEDLRGLGLSPARGTGRKQPRPADDAYDPKTVRTWAKGKGVECPAYGRFLPRAVVEAWRADTQDVA